MIFTTIENCNHLKNSQFFATIEKRAKRSKLFNVNDVKHVIRSSRLDRPFKVIDMGKKHFLILTLPLQNF